MYIMSHFKSKCEGLHLASSQDGLHFEPLNGGKPVLMSSVGAKSIRDPFVFCDQAGLYHLLSTNGWSSRSIVHAVSEDLVHWRDEALLPVMQGHDDIQQTWAPECFFDEAKGRYRIFWSSGSDGPEKDDLYLSIWQTTTADFQTFSEAECLFDPGYSVIDATAFCVNGIWKMCFKDERGSNVTDTDYKNLRICTFPEPGILPKDISLPVSPAPVEGPVVYQAGGRYVMLYDYFLFGRYGASVSDDGETWQPLLQQGLFDGLEARHASVFVCEDARVLEALEGLKA